MKFTKVAKTEGQVFIDEQTGGKIYLKNLIEDFKYLSNKFEEISNKLTNINTEKAIDLDRLSYKLFDLLKQAQQTLYK